MYLRHPPALVTETAPKPTWRKEPLTANFSPTAFEPTVSTRSCTSPTKDTAQISLETHSLSVEASGSCINVLLTRNPDIHDSSDRWAVSFVAASGG